MYHIHMLWTKSGAVPVIGLQRRRRVHDDRSSDARGARTSHQGHQIPGNIMFEIFRSRLAGMHWYGKVRTKGNLTLCCCLASLASSRAGQLTAQITLVL